MPRFGAFEPQSLVVERNARASESAMLDIEFAQLSDVGLIREHNEDCLGHAVPSTPEEARNLGWMFVLADGVGGHERGEVASRIAVDTVTAGFREALAGEPLTSILPRLVQRANTQVYETAMSTGPGGCTMATTLVACALRYDRAVVAHVGDSRCYLIREGFAAALTRDHTIPNEQLRMGLISPREAAAAQTAHVLSRSIGAGMFVSADIGEHQIYAGDVLLICSDGLHNSVSVDDIRVIVRDTGNLMESAAELVDLAKQRDGGDNISVQLIRIRDVERVGMYRGRHYKLR
ncbi:MAG: serine/threonine-protein phosphatase [Acidobacteriaceae bacterium]|nr:serine/threonine-protein phosphatase [Acidobacteriaceae bacterium]